MATKRRSGPSGPTQPEDKRVNKPILLRLPPDVAARLRELAAQWGLNVSEAVAKMIRRAR